MGVYKDKISPEHTVAFRSALEKAVGETDLAKLGYVGLIGSGLVEGRSVHDVDVLVFPNPDVGVGESIIAMNGLYKTVDSILQKDRGLYLATCPRNIFQLEVNYLIGQTYGHKGKISTHTLFFPDFRSFQALNPVDFAKSIKKNSLPLKGNMNVLSQRPNISQKRLEPYFLVADYQIPLVADRYPEILVLQKTEDVVDYLKKHYGVAFNGAFPKHAKDCPEVIDDVLLALDAA